MSFAIERQKHLDGLPHTSYVIHRRVQYETLIEASLNVFRATRRRNKKRVVTVSSASTGTCKAVGSLRLPNAAALLVSTATKTGADEPERQFRREETTASAGTQNDEATSVPVNRP